MSELSTYRRHAMTDDDRAHEADLHIDEQKEREAEMRVRDAAPDLLAALKEIAKGEGRYNQDPLAHAANCIKDMMQIAHDAIAKTEGRT